MFSHFQLMYLKHDRYYLERKNGLLINAQLFKSLDLSEEL